MKPLTATRPREPVVESTWATSVTCGADQSVAVPVVVEEVGGVVQDPIVRLTVWAAVESPPTKTSIVVVSMTQSLVAAFQ
jgi:hypothetical protein